MLAQKIICALSVLLATAGAFRNPFSTRVHSAARISAVSSSNVKSIFRTRSWMAMKDEAAAPAKDFSQYAVGQEYSGTLVGAKNFGVFVNIGTGTNVLVPRSQLTRGNYEKLKRLSDSKSKEQIKIEIISVSAENSTLSGKFVPLNYKGKPDLSVLEGTDISSKFFNATVVGAHDFGLFAELDEFGVEGLVPASKLPEKLPSGSIQTSFP
jgi:ribosomal protein S1